MFVDNQVVKIFEGDRKYDKFAIASTLFAVSFKGSVCSVRESQVLKSCDSCNLKYLCRNIDGLIEDYINETTVVSSEYNFSD
jgi:hypothetical protein